MQNKDEKINLFCMFLSNNRITNDYWTETHFDNFCNYLNTNFSIDPNVPFKDQIIAALNYNINKIEESDKYVETVSDAEVEPITSTKNKNFYIKSEISPCLVNNPYSTHFFENPKFIGIIEDEFRKERIDAKDYDQLKKKQKLLESICLKRAKKINKAKKIFEESEIKFK